MGKLEVFIGEVRGLPSKSNILQTFESKVVVIYNGVEHSTRSHKAGSNVDFQETFTFEAGTGGTLYVSVYDVENGGYVASTEQQIREIDGACFSDTVLMQSHSSKCQEPSIFLQWQYSGFPDSSQPDHWRSDTSQVHYPSHSHGHNHSNNGVSWHYSDCPPDDWRDSNNPHGHYPHAGGNHGYPSHREYQ